MRCPTLDVTFPFILPGWKAEKTSTGYLMISPKMVTDGKRRLIRREGFASRISNNARPHDPGGGGTIRYPVPQNAMMNVRKSPMDMNTNRYEKPVQATSRRSDRSSSDGVTIEQCQSAYRQSTKTTVKKADTNFADKPEPTQYQRTAVSAEEAGTDSTTNVQGRSIDDDKMKTTVIKFPMDCVKFTEPTLIRVSPVEAKMAHTDGTRVMQYQSDSQNSLKMTNMQMPMDFLEIPEPTLPRGFLQLAEEARNVENESGRPCYTEEVQSQGTGLTRPAFVTVVEYSSPVLKKGAMRAAGVSTEMLTTRSSAGRPKPVDQLGLVGPQNQTDQPALPGLDADQVGTVPAGPNIIIDRLQPVAVGPVGQYNTRRPVGTDGMFFTSHSDQPTVDGPVGRFITHSPVGPDRILSACDPDRPVADGPVGQSFILGPVGPRRTFSLNELNQPVAVGPVDQPFTTGPVGNHERESDCKQMDRIADSPVGSTEILDQVKRTGSPIETDFMKLGPITEPASLGDNPPSSDSGVHSLGEQWENMSTSSIEMEPEQNDGPTDSSVTG